MARNQNKIKVTVQRPMKFNIQLSDHTWFLKYNLVTKICVDILGHVNMSHDFTLNSQKGKQKTKIQTKIKVK